MNHQPDDIIVSFDVVSLFTIVPVKETPEFIKQLFPENITTLFHHVLTTTYFQSNNIFHEQIDGVAMGSPLSPVIATFYMEFFETTTLDSSPLKPKRWFLFVDDTFVLWNHGVEAL